MSAAGGGAFKIAFYAPHLQTGGAEMVFIRLAHGLAARGHYVSFVLDRRIGALVDRVPGPLHVLEASRTLAAVAPLAQWLRDHRPDVLLSALSPNNIAAILARGRSGTQTGVIVGEHSLLRQQLTKNWKFRLLPPLVRWLYPRADAVVAVSQAGRDDLAAVLGARASATRLAVLPNPAVDDDVTARARAPVAHPWLQRPREVPVFVIAGRLVPLKNQALAIAALARLRHRRPCRLIVMGEGPEREALIALRAQLSVSDDVDFVGAIADPIPWFAAADGLICCSRYEGFGLTLAEAMACGTQVVTTAAGGPPAELVAGVGPVAANDDADALAAAMDCVFVSPTPREALMERAARFSTSTAVTAYEDLIARVVAR